MDKQEQISNPYAFVLGQITLDCVNGEVEKNMDWVTQKGIHTI